MPASGSAGATSTTIVVSTTSTVRTPATTIAVPVPATAAVELLPELEDEGLTDDDWWQAQPGYQPDTRTALLACIRSYEQGAAGYRERLLRGLPVRLLHLAKRRRCWQPGTRIARRAGRAGLAAVPSPWPRALADAGEAVFVSAPLVWSKPGVVKGPAPIGECETRCDGCRRRFVAGQLFITARRWAGVFTTVLAAHVECADAVERRLAA